MSRAVTDITAAPPKAPPPKKKGLVPPGLKPYLAPILISCILLVGELSYQILESYWHTALAIVAAILLEMVLGRWATGKWPHLASAYITGISVGILVRSSQMWPFIVCSLLSISSKYALRVKGRHLWNPSNLGVSLLLLLAAQDLSPLSQQWGNALWPPVVIMCLGSLILFTLGRLHISLTYVVAFTLLSVLRSGLTGSVFISEVALLTQPSYQLFIFFMITDPKTTTRTWRRQCAVAVLVAVVETLLRLYGQDIANGLVALGVLGREGHTLRLDVHAPYYALFIVAPVTNLLEIWWDAGHRRKGAPIATAGASAAGGGSTAIREIPAVADPSSR